MKLARAEVDGEPVSGRYEGDEDGGVVIEGGGGERDDGGPTEREGVEVEKHEVDGDDLLAPCEPSALYCVGRNYAETLEQMEYDRPEEPDFFVKPPVSVAPPNSEVEYPRFTDELTYAGELAAVIGEECKEVEPDDVSEHVVGYTVMNDLDALDQSGRTARKAFDGSAPLGPWIETDVDPTGIGMWTDVGGERRQDANTELMLFDVHECVSHISERLTLREGDVVAFGSPANPGLVERGETVEIEYEGVGTLRNRVV
ncbi:MAG: fumarylacetoacetate hydrolase family protein [Halobacteria archaeon]|nr:fumarylacetoacetate hydrolase family protein [Halobacteria archaeon]